jgi:hypothetical protein
MYMELGLAVIGYGAPEAHREPTAQDLPGTWDDVAPGHVVLAREILECGWWEAVVVERNGDDGIMYVTDGWGSVYAIDVRSGRKGEIKCERFFTPRLRFKNLDELNAWLLDQCIAYAKAHHHTELTEQTIWEVVEAERPKLVPYAGKFD